MGLGSSRCACQSAQAQPASQPAVSQSVRSSLLLLLRVDSLSLSLTSSSSSLPCLNLHFHRYYFRSLPIFHRCSVEQDVESTTTRSRCLRQHTSRRVASARSATNSLLGGRRPSPLKRIRFSPETCRTSGPRVRRGCRLGNHRPLLITMSIVAFNIVAFDHRAAHIFQLPTDTTTTPTSRIHSPSSRFAFAPKHCTTQHE